jgi:hypothetical protein
MATVVRSSTPEVFDFLRKLPSARAHELAGPFEVFRTISQTFADGDGDELLEVDVVVLRQELKELKYLAQFIFVVTRGEQVDEVWVEDIPKNNMWSGFLIPPPTEFLLIVRPQIRHRFHKRLGHICVVNLRHILHDLVP